MRPSKPRALCRRAVKWSRSVAESSGLFRRAECPGTVTFVIVLVAIPAVLILGWLVLRGRHLDA